MKAEIKQEALEQLELDIKFGFENTEEIFDSIRDMFYEEEDFDDDWLKQAIAQKYDQHQRNSLKWTHPTDFEKLALAFDDLIKEKIVCIHKAGYTKSDGEGDCMETIEKLNELGVKAIGFCYYHTQDLARAVDPDIRNLYLGFDSPVQNDKEALAVANKIIEKLKSHGFTVNWPETVAERIEIKNIDWKKIPDNQEWHGERVIQILTSAQSGKKPFWKFW
jgi:hypothetical protein